MGTPRDVLDRWLCNWCLAGGYRHRDQDCPVGHYVLGRTLTFTPYIGILRGVIKKFSAWPSSVQNKIKIVFASCSNKARNTTYTLWLLGCKYFVHFSGRRLFAFDIEKNGITQSIEMTILTDFSFHCMLCCYDSESKWWIHVSSWITSCEINFCWVVSVSFEKFVSILDTHLTDTVFIR